MPQRTINTDAPIADVQTAIAGTKICVKEVIAMTVVMAVMNAWAHNVPNAKQRLYVDLPCHLGVCPKRCEGREHFMQSRLLLKMLLGCIQLHL